MNPDSEETKQFETSKAESDPKFDPLDDFLSGGSGGNLPPMKSGSPQHFAEPIKDSPTSAGKDIMDTMSFLQHESQPHFTPAAAAAAGDTFMDSQFSAEKEDYSLEDEVIRHKTPSPDLLPEAVNVGGSNSMDDFEFPTNDKKPLSSYPDPFDDFLSKQENKSKPAPVPVPEPVQEPPPVPVRELSPKPREPSPLPVRDYSPIRDPTPEPRDPTPEPPPKPKAPAPSVFESDIFEKKPEKKELKESEPKPVISKPTSPPPAPPKQVALGDSKSCDGLAIWFCPKKMHPTVEALVYWRDPKKSGIVFGGIMVVLLSLAFFSFISVIANLSLIALAAAFGFRVYKTVLQAIQKTSDGHPFKEILEMDLALPADKVRQTSDLAVTHINAIVSELRRLFLVEDFIDSLKFGVGLWMLTYLGSWFNGMTLIILGVVALFTLPKVYESNKAQIDQNIDLVRSKINEITTKVKAAIPIGKKAEEKKDQ